MLLGNIDHMDKCRQDIVAWTNATMTVDIVPGAYLYNLVKIESATAEIFLIWTNVARTIVIWTNVRICFRSKSG